MAIAPTKPVAAIAQTTIIRRDDASRQISMVFITPFTQHPWSLYLVCLLLEMAHVAESAGSDNCAFSMRRVLIYIFPHFSPLRS